MVFELKACNGNAPGVLIFSHKEYMLLFNKKSDNKYLKKLKKSFFIGVHWGISVDKLIKSELIDFHLSLPGLLPENIISNTEIINLTSRNFLSKEYRNYNSEKQYDVITIGRKVKMKRYLEFFLIIKKVMEEKPDLKVMIVAPEDEMPKKSTFDFLFEKNFNEIFSETEKKNITIYSGKKFLPRSEIVELLNKSKVFLFTSIREGVAKVTGEAALCGLKILIFKNFRGNAVYGIDKDQYFLYENIDDCVSKLKNILSEKELNNYQSKNLYEDESLLNLKSFLLKLYEDNSYEFDGVFESNDLMRNLNSFNNTLPRNIVLGNSNDLKDNFSFLKYCNMKKLEVSSLDFILAYFLDFNLKLKETLRRWKNLVPLVIWKIYRNKNQYKKLFK